MIPCSSAATVQEIYRAINSVNFTDSYASIDLFLSYRTDSTDSQTI